MTSIAWVTVQVADGRRVIMPPALGQARGRELPKGEDQRVELTPFVRKRIEQGDLIVRPDMPPPRHEPVEPPPPKPPLLPATAASPASPAPAAPQAPKKEV